VRVSDVTNNSDVCDRFWIVLQIGWNPVPDRWRQSNGHEIRVSLSTDSEYSSLLEH